MIITENTALELYTYQCNPQHQVLVNKTIEILIQEQ